MQKREIQIGVPPGACLVLYILIARKNIHKCQRSAFPGEIGRPLSGLFGSPRNTQKSRQAQGLRLCVAHMLRDLIQWGNGITFCRTFCIPQHVLIPKNNWLNSNLSRYMTQDARIVFQQLFSEGRNIAPESTSTNWKISGF